MFLKRSYGRCHFLFLEGNLFAVCHRRMVAIQQALVNQQQTFAAYLPALLQSTTVVHTSLPHLAQQV
jgi:hypothetical protein